MVQYLPSWMCACLDLGVDIGVLPSPAAILLYNHDDLDGARKQFVEFQRLFDALSEQAKSADADLLERQQALAQLLGVSNLNS